jgi:hypothetical protein
MEGRPPVGELLGGGSSGLGEQVARVTQDEETNSTKVDWIRASSWAVSDGPLSNSASGSDVTIMMLLVRVAFDVSEMPMSPASAGCLAIDPSICLVLVVKNGRSIE